MKKAYFRLVLALYLLVVIAGAMIADMTEVLVPASVLDTQREAMLYHLHSTPAAATAVWLVMTAEVVGLIGLFFCWNLARVIFAAAILGKTLLSPLMAPWLVSTGWARASSELELLMDGAIAVLVWWGPAKHLFQRQVVIAQPPALAGDAARGGVPSGAKLFAGCVLVIAVPVARYVMEFFQGYLLVPYGWTIAVGFPLVALGSILAAVIAPRLLIPVPGPPRWAVGAVLLAVIGFLSMLPAGAVVYARGFEAALRSRADLGQIRTWAADTIRRYDASELKTDGEALYWSPGSIRVAQSEIPAFLQSGMFQRTEHFWGPEIAICPKDGKMEGSETCVAISWSLHGVLVGTDNYRTDWNPWYRRQLAPGVYSYHGMK